jgi:hypothetical protein
VGAARSAFVSSKGSELDGARLVSGTGEALGVVIGIQSDRAGHPKWLVFAEAPGAAPRLAPLRFVKRFEPGVITLKGPREGYHIARVSA